MELAILNFDISISNSDSASQNIPVYEVSSISEYNNSIFRYKRPKRAVGARRV